MRTHAVWLANGFPLHVVCHLRIDWIDFLTTFTICDDIRRASFAKWNKFRSTQMIATLKLLSKRVCKDISSYIILWLNGFYPKTCDCHRVSSVRNSKVDIAGKMTHGTPRRMRLHIIRHVQSAQQIRFGYHYFVTMLRRGWKSIVYEREHMNCSGGCYLAKKGHE